MSEAAPSIVRGLPRQGRPGLSGAALAARVLGSLPRRLELVVGRFGPVTLTFEAYGATSALRSEPVAFALSRGPEAGRLTLDAGLAGRVVAVALGAEGELAPALGRLGPGARGVVAGFVAGVLQAARSPLAVSLAGQDAARPPEMVAVSIGVSVAGGDGWAVLEVPRAWLDEVARLPTDTRELSALTVDAVVELARTTLTVGEAVAVEPGDAIVFDGVAAVETGATWPARLLIGDHSADASVAPDGVVTIESAFDREGSPTDGAASGAGRGDTTVLTALPVEIVAELARVRVRADEVVAFGPDASLQLGEVRRGPVVLRMGAQPRAEGEVTAVDGQLAVRVTRLLR
jgi:flagellar motor switch/type III secretory pathway protein FliN